MFEIQFLFNLVKGTLEALLERFIKFGYDLWRAFPNPVAMFEVWFAFTTGLTGIFVVAPFTAYETQLISILRARKEANRLLTMEQATKMAFDAFKESVKTITFTDDSTIMAWLAGWISRFVYNTVKRIRFLSAIIKAKTESEFYIVVYDSLAKKAGLIRTVAFVIAAMLAVIWFGFLFWLIGFTLLLASGRTQERFLSQDSKRERKRFRNKLVRVNRKRGPDA